MKSLVYFLFLLFLCACGNTSTKNLNFENIDEIKLTEYRKKNIQLQSTLRFLNENDHVVYFKKVEYDVFIDGENVGTFIEKKHKEIPKNGVFTLDLKANFNPEKAFDNLDISVAKIKSDIVADVRYDGYFIIENSEKEEDKTTFTKTQKILFTNKSKLKLNADGTIIEE